MPQNQTKDAKPTVDVVTLSQAIVWDAQGRQLKLGTLWQKQSVILIFLRHFACIACRAHATDVWKDKERYEKTGARLVFIGNGAPEYISIFQSELGMEKALILTDPTLLSFRAAGFKYGFMALAQLKSVLNAVKMHGEGHRQTSMNAEGSHWQLGGVIAVNPMGKIVYHFISESLGDLPPQSDIEVIISAEEQTKRTS